MTDVIAREPSIHAPSRTDLDLQIDLLWRRAAHATDPELQVRYQREHNELVQRRAAQQQGAAG
jgi:hypothetical protein